MFTKEQIDFILRFKLHSNTDLTSHLIKTFSVNEKQVFNHLIHLKWLETDNGKDYFLSHECLSFIDKNPECLEILKIEKVKIEQKQNTERLHPFSFKQKVIWGTITLFVIIYGIKVMNAINPKENYGYLKYKTKTPATTKKAKLEFGFLYI
ncbi:MAG: hypothetical protein ACPGSD_08445 [Flavobacteriales bacterium]